MSLINYLGSCWQ